jgi:pimeloyl-ACP methyl ester carboxylesterase
MDKLGIPKFHAAGHSMGGYILFALHRLAPERLAGGALVSSRALGDNEETRKTREATAQRAEKEGAAFLAGTMPERAVGNMPPPGVTDTLRKITARRSPRGSRRPRAPWASRIDCHPAAAADQVPHRRLRRPRRQDRARRRERSDGEGDPRREARVVREVGPRADARGSRIWWRRS